MNLSKNDETTHEPPKSRRLDYGSSSSNRSSSIAKSPLSNGPSISASVSKSTTNLEKNFERIIDIVEEAGFDSIDSMVSCYYTTKFSPNSLCASAQTLSRRRYLRKFLEDLRHHAKGWDVGEAHGYQEGIMTSAGSVCSEELEKLRIGMREVAEDFERLQNILERFPGADVCGSLKEEKRYLKERVSFEF